MSSGNMASLSVISVLAIILLTSPVFIVGDTCIGASTDHKVYTTTDGASSTETVFLIEFTLVCKNNAKQNLFLNAEVVGKQLPVSRFGDNQYQVSWTEDHKNAPPGNYDVRFYDEEGFSALRKAMRAGDDSAKVKPAFTINVAHKGVSHGPVVGTEVIASGLALLLWYSAYQAKSRIQV